MVFDDILANIVRQISLRNISRLRTIAGFVDGDSDIVIANHAFNSSQDIFGQDKIKLKSSETSKYFECGSCGRQIAGGRFAQHINKCLNRK